MYYDPYDRITNGICYKHDLSTHLPTRPLLLLGFRVGLTDARGQDVTGHVVFGQAVFGELLPRTAVLELAELLRKLDRLRNNSLHLVVVTDLRERTISND